VGQSLEIDGPNRQTDMNERGKDLKALREDERPKIEEAGREDTKNDLFERRTQKVRFLAAKGGGKFRGKTTYEKNGELFWKESSF